MGPCMPGCQGPSRPARPFTKQHHRQQASVFGRTAAEAQGKEVSLARTCMKEGCAQPTRCHVDGLDRVDHLFSAASEPRRPILCVRRNCRPVLRSRGDAIGETEGPDKKEPGALCDVIRRGVAWGEAKQVKGSTRPVTAAKKRQRRKGSGKAVTAAKGKTWQRRARPCGAARKGSDGSE